MAKESVNERKKHQKELEKYLKTIPLPPPEHTAELKMEKKLKRMIQRKERK